ncbi:unnamed protein product [Heterobilharzia americana]|nr:unnamed protein product [Heterobilharzia americana]
MFNERFNQQAINEHNRLRALHGCPELQLDEDLMRAAQKWADNLARNEKLYHSNHNGYGENLAFKMSAAPCQITGEEVSQTWYGEIDYHDFSQCYHSNSRHFTQMIWKSTTHAGFGLAFSEDKTKAYIVGRYLPVGNKGDFRWNVPQFQGLRRSGDNESRYGADNGSVKGYNENNENTRENSENTRGNMYSLDRFSNRSSHRQSFRESLGLSERCKCYWDHTPYAPEGNSVINDEIRSRTGSIRSGDFQRSRPTSFSNNDEIHYKPVYTRSDEDMRGRTLSVNTNTNSGNPEDLHGSLYSPTVINLNFMNPDECVTEVTQSKPTGDFAPSNRVSIRTSLKRPPRSSSPVSNGYNFEKDITTGKDISNCDSKSSL